jgi:hypothetical protein
MSKEMILAENRAKRLLYWQKRTLEVEKELAALKAKVRTHNNSIAKQSIASVYRIEL